MGYEDTDGVYKSLGASNQYQAMSVFELARAIKAREPRLLEIAREMKANEDKAKS